METILINIQANPIPKITKGVKSEGAVEKLRLAQLDFHQDKRLLDHTGPSWPQSNEA